ncbi:MAG: CHAT domain-containing protein, partial [Desulfobacteraceae bacterium]
KIRFLSTKKWSLHCFMSLVQQHLAQDMLSRIDALNAWLRRKGVILEVQKRFQEALIYSEDPEGMKIFQDLARVRTQLQKLIFAGPDKESFDVYKKRIADLRAEEERLEAKLSRVSQGFALKKKIEKADCEKVAGALPPNTALIEFARVAVYNFKAKAKEKRWKPAHYLAFILHSGKGDRVGMIDLGVAEEIDNAVAELREKISDIRDTKGVRTIRSCRKIYDLVFRPLKSELGDVKEIFISPDGNLNLIPFEILQQPDGRYLIEDYTFNYLAAGRDLLGFGQSSGQSKKALLMGDPDFDMGAEEKKTTLRDLDLSQDEERPVSKRSIEMGRFRFGRLPGTREEVEAIFELLGDNQADLYVGKKAVEQVIQETEAPAILHLATHGFFLKDLSLGALANETWHRGIHPVAVIPGPAAKTMKIENPLLRSGIALAGANRTLESGEGGESDGIVTAEKILGLKLQGTDMVVLSACDTGVGEVKTGEGVFGLRRAFTQAGSRSLVMSMWNIPDQETKELMVAFYENILSGEMNRCQSLREAALREMATVKERYGHTNPLYWGGFVFMGEP